MQIKLSEILKTERCSLVVRDTGGTVSTYNKKGVRDLIWLIDNEPQRLRGAQVADKIVGKAAAALMINAGVKTIYAEVLSKQAFPLLNESKIIVEHGVLTERIEIAEGDSRCRLEEIVADAESAPQAEKLLREHFEMMNK